MDRRASIISQLERMGYTVNRYRDPFVDEITVVLATRSGRGFMVKVTEGDLEEPNVVDIVVNKMNSMIEKQF